MLLRKEKKMLSELCNNLKKLRIRRGLNQMELAALMGVSKQRLSKWESGEVLLPIDMLVRFADFFNVSTDLLLGRSSADLLDVSFLTEEQRGHVTFIVNSLGIANDVKEK